MIRMILKKELLEKDYMAIIRKYANAFSILGSVAASFSVFALTFPVLSMIGIEEQKVWDISLTVTGTAGIVIYLVILTVCVCWNRDG